MSGILSETELIAREREEKTYELAKRCLLNDGYSPDQKKEMQKTLDEGVHDFENYQGPLSNHFVNLDRYFDPLFEKAQDKLCDASNTLFLKEFRKTVADLQKRRDKMIMKYDSIDRQVDKRISKLEKSLSGATHEGDIAFFEGELLEVKESRNHKKHMAQQADWMENHNCNEDCVNCRD
jgi:uncharacterized membrane-anchored protein YhcB (DUF1043 family)